MMVKGIDIGYTYTKDENKNIFRSAYTMDEQFLGSPIKLELDNEIYYIGIGKGTVELNKCSSKVNQLCLLADLAMSPDSEFFIVSGLPISQYKRQEVELKNFILNQNGIRVRLNDTTEKIILIKDVKIFPQGLGALYTKQIKESMIIVDIGGRTVDVAFVDIVDGRPAIRKSNTWFLGMLQLYTKIIDSVNNKFELELEPQEAQKIIQNGLKIYGKDQDVRFLIPILRNHFEEIFYNLRLNYPVETTSIYLCGGGSKLLFDSFKNRFPNVELCEDEQFANAKGFYTVGLNAFGKYVNNKNLNERKTMVWQDLKRQ